MSGDSQGAMHWSAVCDCGVSLSYSLAFFKKKLKINSSTYLNMVAPNLDIFKQTVI